MAQGGTAWPGGEGIRTGRARRRDLARLRLLQAEPRPHERAAGSKRRASTCAGRRGATAQRRLHDRRSDGVRNAAGGAASIRAVRSRGDGGSGGGNERRRRHGWALPPPGGDRDRAGRVRCLGPRRRSRGRSRHPAPDDPDAVCSGRLHPARAHRVARERSRSASIASPPGRSACRPAAPCSS